MANGDGLLDASMTPASKTGEEDEATPLVLALCHEIGNLVGAVRLQAHLLDSEFSPKELASTSIEVEDLCARASALLSHMRPLLTDASRGGDQGVLPEAVLNALQYTLEDFGGRGVALSFDCQKGLPELSLDPDTVQQLLLTLAFGALEAARPRGCVVIRALPGDDAGGVSLVVEDDGEDEDLCDWSRQMLRGRVLACAVANRILVRRGGRLAVDRSQGITRVALVLPRK